MGLKHMLTLLPLAATIAQAQNTTTDAAIPTLLAVNNETLAAADGTSAAVATTTSILDAIAAANAVAAATAAAADANAIGATTTGVTTTAVNTNDANATNANTNDVNATITTIDVTTTNDFNITNTTNSTTDLDAIVSAPIYTPEECNSWLTTLAAADADSSNGLSENEYHTFLESIEDPPYISEYFEAFSSFDKLPWMFRVVHKSLACHCQKLGRGEECCKGDDAEVLLLGLISTADGVNASITRVTPQQEYKDLFCQQIAYILTKSVPSPAPTGEPSVSPSKSPTVSPTGLPSVSPTTSSPTVAPASVTLASVTPTKSPSVSPTMTPVEAVIPEVRAVEPIAEEEKDEGLGTGGIIGIIIACLLALLAVIALVAYRKKQERDRLRKFAGAQAPEADLEAQPPGDELYSEPHPLPDNEPHDPAGEPEEDDESEAPSVWSDSDENEGEAKLHDVNVGGEVGDTRQTAGSALAAMGAASTVAANLSKQPNQEGSGSDSGSGSRINSVV